jgi:hypothetical protein
VSHTTLHFLFNFQMGPISCSVTLHNYGKFCQRQRQIVYLSIPKLQRKRSVENVPQQSIYFVSVVLSASMALLLFSFSRVLSIDIERRKNRLLKFCYVPATSAAHNRLLFFYLLRLFTVLMKQTRQAVHAVTQSIILDVYGPIKFFTSIIIGFFTLVTFGDKAK